MGFTGPAGGAGAETPKRYIFTLNYTGTAPTSVTGLPGTWSAAFSSNDVTITHDVGLQIAGVTYFGFTSGTGIWHARYPTAASELTFLTASSTTAFTFRASNTTAGCDSGGQARVVCMF
jgi:hypothetical protein